MMNSGPLNRLTLFARTALVLSSALFVIAAVPTIARKFRGDADGSTPPAQRRIVKGRVDSGTELIAFFIASSTCGASQHPTLPLALRQIRDSLTVTAKSEGKRFIFAGVALDETPAKGLEFLKPFGPFDEVIAGGSWLGTGAVDFLIRSMPGPLAMPQLLILERDVVAEKSTITVGPDRIVTRVLGFAEIFKMAGLSAESAATAGR